MRKGKSAPKTILLRYLGIICLVLVATVAMNSIIDAKYVTTKRNDPIAVAQEFYFESDLLKADDTPVYTLPAGTREITFRLKNYTDALRYTDSPIVYNVLLNGTVKVSQQKIDAGSEEYVTVTITVDGPGTYDIVAEATSPYTAALRAQFVISVSEEGIEHFANDLIGSPVVQLTVRTNGYEGNVSIKWPDGVKPDNTDPLLKNATGSSTSILFDNDSEHTFIFFKSNHDIAYEANDFIVG